jgi:hypothetical protein
MGETVALLIAVTAAVGFTAIFVGLKDSGLRTLLAEVRVR